MVCHCSVLWPVSSTSTTSSPGSSDRRSDEAVAVVGAEIGEELNAIDHFFIDRGIDLKSAVSRNPRASNPAA